MWYWAPDNRGVVRGEEWDVEQIGVGLCWVDKCELLGECEAWPGAG